MPPLRTLLLLLSLLSLTLADPLPAKARLERVYDTPVPEATRTYLVTLDRAVGNLAKDGVLDALMRANAVVKQVYDYRVYKGVLFSVPTVEDKGLRSWINKIGQLEGVKAVEEDQVVKTN